MAEVTVMIDDQEVDLKAAGNMLRLYKKEFKEDLLTKIFALTGGGGGEELSEEVDEGLSDDKIGEGTELVMNVMWVFAKAANPGKVKDPITWEGQFELGSLMNVANEHVMELLTANLESLRDDKIGKHDKKKTIERMKKIQAEKN